MTTRRLALLLIIAAARVPAQEADTLSLEEAMTRAAAHSRVLRLSAARADAAVARAAEANALMLPALKAEAGYRRLSEVDPFQVQVPGGAGPVVIFPSIEDNTVLRGTLQMPLFAGFRLRNSALAAEAVASAAAAETRSDSNDVRLAAAAAYWQVFAIRQVRMAVDSNVLRLRSYEEDARRLMDAGSATLNDLLRVQVQLGTARLAALDAAHDEDLARASLNTLIGNPPERPVALSSAPGDPTGSAGPVPGMLTAAALKQRPDLLALDRRVRAAERMRSAAAGGWWPQVGLQAGYTYARPNSRILPAVDEFRGTWEVGVSLQMDVWNWGLTAHQVDAAEAGVRQAEAARDFLRDQVVLDVRRQSLAVERAGARVDVAMLTLAQSAENLRSLQLKFRAGLATSTELLDADVAHVQSRTSAATASAELAVARTRLRRAVGDLP
jgi:outer membrane protein TolC